MASEAINRLIQGLGRLPGIGNKSARRIALEILTWETEDVRALSELMVEVKTKVRQCSVCFNLTEVDPCAVCSDPRRDRSLLRRNLLPRKANSPVWQPSLSRCFTVDAVCAGVHRLEPHGAPGRAMGEPSSSGCRARAGTLGRSE